MEAFSAYLGTYDPAPLITIEHSTITGNIADRDGLYPASDPGGGLHAELSVYAGPDPERVQLSHTIVANNARGSLATPDDATGNIEADFSLFESYGPARTSSVPTICLDWTRCWGHWHITAGPREHISCYPEAPQEMPATSISLGTTHV